MLVKRETRGGVIKIVGWYFLTIVIAVVVLSLPFHVAKWLDEREEG